MDEDPDWFDNYSAFVGLLRSEFGPIDPEAEAEDLLDNLRMKDGHKLLKYNVEFQRLSTKVDWGDSALCHRYYSGLPDRIKDVLQNQAKARSLTELKASAPAIDARHWERQREKS